VKVLILELRYTFVYNLVIKSIAYLRRLELRKEKSSSIIKKGSSGTFTELGSKTSCQLVGMKVIEGPR